MDFSMKNNKIVNHFSNFKERSTITPMEVLADGTQANENPAACYRGLGCVSGNNSSRLLLDYKVEHPHAYEEIMRLLFQKDYGAGLTHIKLELGADVNSSSGTEPCTKRSLNEPADVTRGAGFQFAADAKAINPDITIDMLRWGEPKWVTDAFVISQEHGLRARYRWYKETLDAAYAVYGLKFDYISADQNETDTPDEAWILYLRHMLDNEKNAPYDYSKIKLIASDEVGTNGGQQRSAKCGRCHRLALHHIRGFLYQSAERSIRQGDLVQRRYCPLQCTGTDSTGRRVRTGGQKRSYRCGKPYHQQLLQRQNGHVRVPAGSCRLL